jgi:hypothetical protein
MIQLLEREVAPTVVPSHQFSLVIRATMVTSSSAAIGGNRSNVRGPPWKDLSGAAVLSGESGTLDVQIISSSSLALSSINHFLLPQ